MGTRRRSERTTRRIRGRIRLLGAWLALTLLVASLGLGGAPPETRVVVHLMLAVGCLGAALLPAPVLEHAGIVRPLAAGFSVLLGVVAVGLLPLPAAVLGWVAPGTLAARPDAEWWTLTLSPEATVGEVAFWGMCVGTAALAGTWGAVRWRRGELEHGVVLLTAVLVGVALLHLAGGLTELFGAVGTSLVVPGTFYAPFVDPNHFGSAMVLVLPVLGGVALAERRWSGWWSLVVVTAVLALVLLVRADARGALVGLAVAAGLAGVGAEQGLRRRALLAGLAVVGVVAVATVALGGNGAVSLAGRFQIWGRAAVALADAWLAGTGGGTIGEAIEPYRTDHAYMIWGHLHNDLLEWLVETGAIGLVGLGVAAWLLWPRSSREPGRARWLTLGLVALIVASLVEFPLQMPGIALAAVAMLAGRRAVFEDRYPSSATAVRAVLVGAVVLQVLGAAWSARAAVAERAVVVARAWDEDPEAAKQAVTRLRRVAPWRPEVELVAAWEARAAGDADGAARHAEAVVFGHPDDPRALRQAGLVLLSVGAVDGARAALERAEERAPSDWRNAVALARAAPALGEDPVEAWRRALLRHAPPAYLEQALTVMPVGLYWLDVIRELPGRYGVRLAQLAAAQGDAETALLAHEHAALADPALYADSPGHAAALLAVGRLEEAEAMLRRGLEGHPDDARYLDLLGEVLQRTGRHAEAADAFLAAGRTRPIARIRAIRAAEQAGGPDEALRLVRRLDLIGSDDALTRLEVARVFRDAGQQRACVLEIERNRLVEVPALSGRARQLLRDCGGPP